MPIAVTPPTRSPAPVNLTLVLVSVLGVGALLIVCSTAPDRLVMRTPLGLSMVRARVELALIGTAIVALVFATYLVVASS
jgi:hypothetical protein